MGIKMKKYTLTAGHSVIPFSIDDMGNYHLHHRRRVKTTVTYSQKSKIPERAQLTRQLVEQASQNGHPSAKFYAFWLPLNHENFAGFLVSKHRLIITEDS